MKFYKLNFIILLPLLFSTIIIRAQILEIDTTFKIGFGFDGPVNDIGIQSDGKLIVIGNFNHYNNFLSPKIARLNTDGTFDNSFTSHLSSKIGSLNKLEIQSNGQILIVGNGIVAIDSTIILPGFTLFANFARLNPNGDIDMNFTKNVYNSTYVLLGIPPGDADFKIQNDGSILYLLGNISDNYMISIKI